MKRIWATGLLCILTTTPAFAAYTPLYAGVQIDNTSGSALVGYQLNKTFAVEAHVTKSDTHITDSGVTFDTHIVAAGLAALAMLPMRLEGGSAYFLFVKAGYERLNKDEIYTSSNSTINNGTVSNYENRTLFGGGAQYDFYKAWSGRVGIDVVGQNRSVYIGTILKF